MKNKGFLGLAVASVAILGLASCSSSDDNGGTPFQPSKVTVGALLDDVTANYKSTVTNCLAKGGTRAAGTGWSYTTDLWGQKHVIPQTMPDEPRIPADAKEFILYREDGAKIYEQSHAGDYVVPAGKTVDVTDGGFNFTDAKIYVAGTFKVKEGWGNGTIYVLKGGRLELYGDDQQLIHNVGCAVYNYGTIKKTSKNLYIANSEALYNRGTIDIPGKEGFRVQGTLYQEGNISGYKSYFFEDNCQVNILGNLDMTGVDVPKFAGYVHVGGKVAAKSLTLIGNGFLAADCSVDVAGTFEANSSNNLYTDYLHAHDVKQASSSKIFIGDGGFVNIDGTYDDQNSGIDWQGNVGCGIYLTSGVGTHAVVKASEMRYNSQNVAFLDTRAGGTIGVDCPKYVYWNSTETEEPNFDVAQGGTAQRIDTKDEADLKAYYIPATGCNPGYGENPEPATPDKPNEGKHIVEPVVVSTQHTHDISATCVQSDGSGNVYLSFHKQGAGESGCVEKLTTVNDQTTLDQFVRDHNNSVDFNHIMLNGNRLYAVGHTAARSGSTAGGSGFLGYISLAGGKMNTQDSVIVANDSTYSYSPLQMVKLQGGDGNAVVMHNNQLKVASTYGLEVFNPSDLSEVGERETTGKGKHIALGDNGNAYFSHFTTRNNDTTAPLALQIEQLDNDNNAASVINGTEVAPNDGKNVICEAGDRIYSAEGINGLQVYDLSGNKVGEYVLKHANAAGNTLYYAANGVAVDNDYVYVAYGSYGLRILNRSDLSEVAKFVSGGSANYVALANNYIYVAYGRSNIKVLKLVDVTE